MKITGLIIILCFLTGFAFSQPSIKLKSGQINPGKASPDISRSQGLSVSSQSTDRGKRIIQFKSSTTEEYRDSLEEKNSVEFLSYVPENAWFVSGGSLSSVKGVRFETKLKPEHKLAPGVNSLMKKSRVDLTIEMFDDSSSKSALKSHGKIISETGSELRMSVESDQIFDLASEEAVKWVSATAPRVISSNDESRDLVEVEQIQSSPYNLKGDGFTAGIWDGGWAGDHNDLDYNESKVTTGDKGENCDYDPTSKNECQIIDHATHVSGTMLGAGVNDYTYRGMAPNSSLATYEWPAGNDTELYAETNESINQYSADVSQNSWNYQIEDSNKDVMGDYRGLADEYDEIISNTTNKLSEAIPIVFSAGNYGNDFSFRYNTTAGPGATAKNVITVGAVDGSGNMNSFSSWGPTDDGRIKPTLVADGGGNGGFVKSTLPDNSGGYYGNKQGTSMAAPAVAGASLLVQQQYNQTHGELASPATIKAALIHTSTDINRTGPDYVTGWGLVNATKAVDYINESGSRDLIKTGELNQGEKDSFSVQVPKNEDVRFTLVWSDYPSAEFASKTLVNDLDLVVENSSGDRKYPWSLSWENRTQPALQTQEDHTNPVEQVYIASTGSNSYTIEVNGSDVPQPAQEYSLLVSSAEDVTAPDLDIRSPMNQTYRSIPYFNLSADEPLADAVYSLNGNPNQSMNQRNSTYFYRKPSGLGNGTYTAEFWANDSSGNFASESVSFTMDSEKPSVNAINPSREKNISGTFNLNATASDSITPVEKLNYTISNTSFSQKGPLNTSLDSNQFQDGKYNLTFNATDAAGNYNFTRFSVTLDNTEPVLRSYTPEEGDYFDSDFDVNASFSDSLTGVEEATFELENASLQDSGDLNSSVDASKLSSGRYNLTFKLQDYALNNYSKQLEIIIDSQKPNLTVLNPQDDDYVGINFSLNASWSDQLSGIKEANYSISNTSEQLNGSLNSTINTDELAEGEYNVTFSAYDKLSNSKSEKINVTLDKKPPQLNYISPSENETLRNNFSVNASYSDILSGVSSAEYYLENTSVQKSGSLNATLNSTLYSDGQYNLTLNVSDRASNTVLKTRGVTLDNSPPSVKSSTVSSNDNLSGIFDINLTLFDISNTGAEFRWANSSGNVTEWTSANYTDFNSSNLSDGVYNLSLNLSDTPGNTNLTNLSDITIDNTEPSLSLKEYNLSSTYDGWINNSKTVEASCSDGLSGLKQISVSNKTSSSTPNNFTLTETGNITYAFSCVDFSGNNLSKQKTYAIDSSAPDLASVKPSNNSETDRTYTLQADFNDESLESGLNLSDSKVTTSDGSVTTEWSNSSFNASFSDLAYSESYSMSGRLVDNLGHVSEFVLEYEVEDDPNSEPESGSSGSSGGSGGGGVAVSGTSSSAEENKTQEPNQTENLSGGTDTEEEQSCDRRFSAVRNKKCEVFNQCRVPRGWKEVESCQQWRKDRAENLIENLSQRGADRETLEEAREAFEQGNYSEAISRASKALNASEKNSDEVKSDQLVYISGLLLLTLLLPVTYFCYRFYQRRKLVERVETLTESVLNGEVDETDLEYTESQIMAAAEALENENYAKAKQILENSPESA